MCRPYVWAHTTTSWRRAEIWSYLKNWFGFVSSVWLLSCLHRAHTLCEGQPSIPPHCPINYLMAGLAVVQQHWLQCTNAAGDYTDTAGISLNYPFLKCIFLLFVFLFFFLPGTFLLPSHLHSSSLQDFFFLYEQLLLYASSQNITFKYKQSLSPPTQRQVFTWN